MYNIRLTGCGPRRKTYLYIMFNYLTADRTRACNELRVSFSATVLLYVILYRSTFWYRIKQQQQQRQQHVRVYGFFPIPSRACDFEYIIILFFEINLLFSSISIRILVVLLDVICSVPCGRIIHAVNPGHQYLDKLLIHRRIGSRKMYDCTENSHIFSDLARLVLYTHEISYCAGRRRDTLPLWHDYPTGFSSAFFVSHTHTKIHAVPVILPHRRRETDLLLLLSLLLFPNPPDRRLYEEHNASEPRRVRLVR